jgi:cell division protein FtsI/penicillin-binding protein 2
VRLIAARHLAGAIVIEDVRTGAVVAFASVPAVEDSPAKNLSVDVTSPILPLSISKVLLAASWWAHEHQINASHRSAPTDVHEMLVAGSDSAGGLLANALREAVGAEVVLDDLNRFGFPPCPNDDAQKIDTSFWQTLVPQWQTRLAPAAACTDLSVRTNEAEWSRALSVGESSFSVTLLHLSRFMQAIGNRGIMLQPTALDARTAVVPASQPAAGKKIMDASTVSKLESAMIDNVDRGTAKSIRGRLGPKWMMGGKTGTGPANANPFDGCFAGLVFDDHRAARYTVVAYIKRGGSGGGAAAEISADLFKYVLGL